MKLSKEQVIPLALTTVIFFALVLLLYCICLFLNFFTSEQIIIHLSLSDIIIGTTIYLKTSIDFAIFMGNLMRENTGMKSRIAIEIGTALGNALGTLGVLILWDFFKELNWLLASMIVLAALVLLEMAQDGVMHTLSESKSKNLSKVSLFTQKILSKITFFTSPIISKILPHASISKSKKLPFRKLFYFSITIPFILGLDDFAGYVPLFNIINVFGFAIGVFLGHMILNIFLFLSPKRTITLVKNAYISYIGSLAFVALAFWGIWEAIKLLILSH